eukprot:Skav221592  [mRNA]  locus=scaffold1698:278442:283098:+ [translate_table: standard]
MAPLPLCSRPLRPPPLRCVTILAMENRPVPINLDDFTRGIQIAENGGAVQYQGPKVRFQGVHVPSAWPDTPTLDAQRTATPESSASFQGGSSSDEAENRTTLVLKNLPRHFDKEALKVLLEKLGPPARPWSCGRSAGHVVAPEVMT